MVHNDSKKITALIIVSSIILTLIEIFLFFLDKSLIWDFYKIFSCIVVSIFVFFTIPSYRYFYFKEKNMTFVQGFRLGYFLGFIVFFIPIITAPYFGLKYYFNI